MYNFSASCGEVQRKESNDHGLAGLVRKASPTHVGTELTPGRFLRLLDCTAIGVAMALTAYLCAWYGMRDHYGYRRPHQLRAFSTLRTLSKALDEYHNENGNYPEKLADLKRTHPDSVRLEDSGQVVDPWSNPYQYRAEGDHYTLFSFGRDGKTRRRGT